MDPQPPQPRNAIPLRKITARLAELLLPATVPQMWVQAQFIPEKTNRAGGHCYGSLVEVDDSGRTVAKIRATIWESELQLIWKRFLEAGIPDALTTSQEICALCSVRYHAVHGLSLSIFDVDLSTGESNLERNRRIVLESLQRDGLLSANKAVELTAAPLRIGLVTADGSAALADFRQTLLLSPFSFRILLAPVAVQGDATVRSVIAAIESLNSRQVDLICIVRGGGSPADLAWLNAEPIARAVAQCPVPVWVGIGHEIDHGVLDIIAHTSHKTPTAVAQALVERLAGLAARLELARERLRDVCDRQTALAELQLKHAASSLTQDGRKHVERFEAQFVALIERYRALARRITEQEAIRLQHARSLIHGGFERRIGSELANLSEKSKWLEALNPERLLARGYSIARDETGRPITSAAALAAGQTIRTQFWDGTAASVVTSTEDSA